MILGWLDSLSAKAPNVSLPGLPGASGCSLFRCALTVRLASFGSPLLLARLRIRRPAVAAVATIAIVVASIAAARHRRAVAPRLATVIVTAVVIATVVARVAAARHCLSVISLSPYIPLKFPRTPLTTPLYTPYTPLTHPLHTLTRYIRNLFVLVVAYGMSINMVEVTWKGKLKQAS